MQIATHSGVTQILDRFGIKPRKSLGQNFLTDQHVLGKIIRAANIKKDDSVLEIGPGIGGLTQALAESAGQLIAVELDERFVNVLNEMLPHVEVVHSDILKYAIPGHINKVVANLPYYVTTPIIMHLLENYRLESITVMVQREVAQRMAGKPGNKSYGSLSLAVEYHAKAHIAANVPPNCFIPRPKVGSCVVHMDVLSEPPVTSDKQALFANIRAGFGQRRKTLVNGLYSAELYPDLSKGELAEIMARSGLSENVRGEELTLEDWARLTGRLNKVQVDD